MKDLIYSENIIGLVRMITDYCSLCESAQDYSKRDFFLSSQKIMSGLYYKILTIEEIYSDNEYSLEKFITEADWEFIKQRIANKLGEQEVFLELLEPMADNSENVISISLSELYADIYQDLRDFLEQFRLGTEEIMRDSLVELQLTFKQFWGHRIILALSQIHNFIYGNHELDED